MALEGSDGTASRPGHSLPPGKTRYPLYRRLGGPQGRSGQVRKISPPQGFNPQTAPPIASCYTDYATWPKTQSYSTFNNASTQEVTEEECKINVFHQMLWGPWADKYHGQVSLDVQNVIISEYCNSAYVLV